MTPSFGSFSLKNNLSSSLNYLQNAPSNSVHLTSSFSYAARFVKMMAIFEIISATDSIIQNIISIVCVC